MNPQQRAIQQNQRARSRAEGRQLQRLRDYENRLKAGGAAYVGYDADTGLHSAVLPNGQIAQGSFISNSGVSAGDRIAYTRGSGGIFYKGIPK